MGTQNTGQLKPNAFEIAATLTLTSAAITTLCSAGQIGYGVDNTGRAFHGLNFTPTTHSAMTTGSGVYYTLPITIYGINADNIRWGTAQITVTCTPTEVVLQVINFASAIGSGSSGGVATAARTAKVYILQESATVS